MDQRLEQALQTANLMATFANQRRAAYENFKQQLIHYTKGSSFLITRDLISFVKTMIDQGYTQNVVLIDDNGLPVSIEDLKVFQETIVDQYYRVSNQYFSEYSEIKSKRKIEDLVSL
jgi:hypothetical protein